MEINIIIVYLFTIVVAAGAFGIAYYFYKWINTTSLNKVERRDIIISLLNEEHSPVITWKAKNAFAIKVQASDLKSDGNEVAIETLELAHEGLNILN